MAYDLPIYKVVLDDDSDQIDFNSIVDTPAHSKSFDLFGKETKREREKFNDEKMIVTGVAVATDVPIYRRDNKGREYYLYFTADETRKFAQRLFERNYMNNVNEMHDSNQTVESMKLIESFFIDRKRGVNPPDAFKDQNLKDGTWIVSYQVTDTSTWEKLKSGVYTGFSVEGWFTLVKQNFKNQIQMSEEKKDRGFFAKIKDMLNADNTEPAKEIFGEAVTTDGATIVWDGEMLEVGNELRIKSEDDAEILAPEGVMSVAQEDGTSWVITVDANGIVTEFETIEAEEETEDMNDTDEVAESVVEMAKVITEMKAAHSEEIAEMKADFDKKIETLSQFLDQKENTNKKKDQSVPTWKDFSSK